jgi:hypothetical protein
MLAILLRAFGFIGPKTLNYLAFQSFDFEHTYEGYSRNAQSVLNLNPGKFTLCNKTCIDWVPGQPLIVFLPLD